MLCCVKLYSSWLFASSGLEGRTTGLAMSDNAWSQNSDALAAFGASAQPRRPPQQQQQQQQQHRSGARSRARAAPDAFSTLVADAFAEARPASMTAPAAGADPNPYRAGSSARPADPFADADSLYEALPAPPARPAARRTAVPAGRTAGAAPPEQRRTVVAARPEPPVGSLAAQQVERSRAALAVRTAGAARQGRLVGRSRAAAARSPAAACPWPPTWRRAWRRASSSAASSAVAPSASCRASAPASSSARGTPARRSPSGRRTGAGARRSRTGGAARGARARRERGSTGAASPRPSPAGAGSRPGSAGRASAAPGSPVLPGSPALDYLVCLCGAVGRGRRAVAAMSRRGVSTYDPPSCNMRSSGIAVGPSSLLLDFFLAEA